MKTNSTAINSTEVLVDQGKVPEWVALIPAGKVSGRDGRSWNNNRPGEIVEAFSYSGMDIPVDIEHSTELKAPHGDPAPAIGWAKELQDRNGAIWGKVEWTAEGKTLVGKRAYRYLSPVIIYQRDSGTIVGLTSVGVTNRPNLRLPALNNQHGGNPKETAMLKALLAALGLPENATEIEATTKISNLKTDLATARNREENPSLEKFVPRADYDAALSKAVNAEKAMDTIKKEQLEIAINTAIDAALKDGKITPATADYHRAQCRQDGGLERFAEFCTAAPVIGDLSGLDGKKPEGETKALNAEEKKICATLGVAEEDYLKIAM
jgi:phage I-like protein